ALVGVLLDLDQVRDRDRGVDLLEAHPVPIDVADRRVHQFVTSEKRAGAHPRARLAQRETAPERDTPPRSSHEPKKRRRRPRPLPPVGAAPYLISTVAPTSSNFFLMLAASSFETPSLTTLGAPSTRSLASFRPRLVTSRTTLITLIFLSPAAVRWTANSVFSSAGAAAA